MHLLDTINIQSGDATFKDITVYGAVDSADAIFILGGNVTVENCTVSSGKAGINVDNRNGNAVVNVKGGKFANYTDSKDALGRNCAIELRNDASNVTLSGDITFETNVIISKAASTVAIKDAIKAGEGYTVTFTAGSNIQEYVTNIEKQLKEQINKDIYSDKIFTDAQYYMLDALLDKNHFSFSGPTSFGKSFILTSFIKNLIMNLLNILLDYL